MHVGRRRCDAQHSDDDDHSEPEGDFDQRIAAALAGRLTYFVTPSTPVDADQRLPAIVPTKNIERHPTAEEQAATAFERAAETILKRLRNAQTSADIGAPTITGHIPLPKRRPIPRP
jgi:hypothetical protein